METGPSLPQDELNRLRGLLRVLSHELRTPLGTVLMQAQLLELELGSNPKAGKRVRGVQTACRQITGVLDDLSDMVLAEGGQLELDTKAVALAEFIATLGDREPSVLALDRLRIDAAIDLPPVECDPGRLERILVNLVGHVLEHTSGDAPVALTFHHDANAVWVDLAAGAAGTAVQGTALFPEFARNRSVQGNRGLKLRPYIAWLLARAHGGDLQVVADSACGSSYRLTLPLHQPRLGAREKGA